MFASSPLPLAFDSDNTAGNLLIVVAGVTSNGAVTTFSYSDTSGNTAQVKIQQFSDVESSVMYIVPKCKAGANTVTIKAADGSGVDSMTLFVIIHEFSGVDTEDQYSSAIGTGLTQSSGLITTTKADELLFGYGAALTLGILSQGNVLWTVAQTDSSKFLTQYNVVSSVNTYNSTTVSTGSKSSVINWIEEIISFYGPSSNPTNQIITF